MKDLAKFVTKWGTGINLGNTFDTSQHPWDLGFLTDWTHKVKAKGINHIRVPITWLEDSNTRKFVSFERTKTNYICHFNEGEKSFKDLFGYLAFLQKEKIPFVINTHHEKTLKAQFNGDKNQVYTLKWLALWRALALHFRGLQPNDIMFELLNEPNDRFGNYGGSRKPDEPDYLENTRKIMDWGYEAIRDVDSKRIILITCNAQSAPSLLNPCFPKTFKSDERLGAVVHCYNPWSYCGENGSDAGVSKESLKKEITRAIGISHDWSVKTGHFVHLNEFGVGRTKPELRNNDFVRFYYHELATQARASGRIIPCAWDDRGWFGLTDTKNGFPFGLIDQLR